MRLACYVDGFNLYHAINDLRQPHLKWLDLWSLAQSLARPDETLVAVNYFSAYATWLPPQYARHRNYTKALKLHGVSVHMARFKTGVRQCYRCGNTWDNHEEKETDVRIAVKLVTDVFDDIFDRAIVISADSDLVPAIELVRARFPKKHLLVAAPPGRFSSARDLKPRLEISKARLAKHLLPAEVYDKDGALVTMRPNSYDPPATS